MCFVFAGLMFGGDAAAEPAAHIPPLTEAQRVQLETADDTRPPDEPAWYGLLSNVASWEAPPPGAKVAGGGTPPDYAALMQSPGALRGDVFVVEGRFAGRQRRQVVLREGPWGRALTEWGVVVDPAAGGGEERVVVVYLVDPDGRQATPRRNQRVRVAARFYKLWPDADGTGRAVTYPVFVGRSAALIEPEGWAAGRMFRDLIVAAIIVLMAGLFGIRWWARRQRVARRRPRLSDRRRPVDRPGDSENDDAPPLPDDPAEALAELDAQPDAGPDAGPRDA